MNCLRPKMLALLVSMFVLLACYGKSSPIALPETADLRGLSWTQAFDAFHTKYSTEYVFTQWRGIDWAALKATYRPMIEAAEVAGDTEAYLSALRGYTFSIPDGHVILKSAAMVAISDERMAGGFGLCITGLDDGSVIADLVLTGGPAAAAGIVTGAVITTWNGAPIDTALANVDLLWRRAISPIATDEYETIERARYLTRAPVGTSVTITFQNEGDLAPQNAALTAVSDDFATLDQANFAASADMSVPIAFEILESGYGYLKVSFEGSDQGAYDPFRNAIKAFVDANVPGVIIDLRGNHGGDDFMASKYAGFFYETPAFYEYQNFYNLLTRGLTMGIQGESGAVAPGGSVLITPQSPHYGGPVVALVNPRTISSGEGVAMGISRAPHGQVIAFHGTNGSFGMVGDKALLPPDVEIGFPYGQSLGSDKVIQLDSKDGVGGVAPTVRVPLTKEAAIAFASGADPELDYAVEWLQAHP